MRSGRYWVVCLLCTIATGAPMIIAAQEDEKPKPRTQVMLGIRVLKVSLAKKYSEGLDWDTMPFRPGLNKKIDFYKVLRKLKTVGDVELLFSQSLIGIAGGTIEAERMTTMPVDSRGEKTVDVGCSFKGTVDVGDDEARLGLDYRISYLYGPPPHSIANTEFKADVAIGNGETLVMDDLVVENGDDKKQAQVLVFISALIIR